MAGLLDLLAKPVSADESCGPDLELEEDKDYWIFLGSLEPMLPKSLQEYEEFGDKIVDFKSLNGAALKLLERSHDLRILIALAKLRILHGDFDGFLEGLEGIQFFVREQWPDCHPKDDFGYRVSVIEGLDFMPDTGYPLRDTAIFPSTRIGKISYKTLLIARGLVSAGRFADAREEDVDGDERGRPGVSESDISLAVRILKYNEIKDIYEKYLYLASLLEGIEVASREQSDGKHAVKFGQINSLVSDILGFISQCLSAHEDHPADAGAGLAGSLIPAGEEAGGPAAGLGGLTSAQDAEKALAAAAAYFDASEPSSPARLYLAQARALVGRSFVEALEILAPEHLESASLPLGKGLPIKMPLTRLAGLLASNESGYSDYSSNEGEGEGAYADETSSAGESVDGEGDHGENWDGGALPELDEASQPVVRLRQENGPDPFRVKAVSTRQQALQLIEAACGYFRKAEPASPIPLLLDEARAIAHRDFVSNLRNVLPPSAFPVDE